jgi:hypothetical protein
VAIESLETLSEATEELQHAQEWYEQQRAGLGTEFLDSVNRTVTFISEYPDAGVSVPGIPPDKQVKRIPIRRFSISRGLLADRQAHLYHCLRSRPTIAGILAVTN